MGVQADCLFVISKPMHYLHAEEFCKKRQISPQSCAILVCTKTNYEEKNLNQIRSIISPEKWATVQYIGFINFFRPPKEKRTFLDRIKLPLLKLKSTHEFVRKVEQFSSNYLKQPLKVVALTDYTVRHHRHIAAVMMQNKNAKELVICDEGSSMHNFTVPLRKNPAMKTKASYFEKRFTRSDWAGWGLRIMAGLKFHFPPNVTLFTVYKDIEPPAHDTLEANPLSLMRQQSKTFVKTDEVWFLGTCYVEQGIGYQDAYLDILTTLRAKYGHSRLKYFPHRGESGSKLKCVEEIGYEVCEIETAIEPWFITNKEMPQAIAAIATSAIDNFSTIFRGDVPILIFRPSPRFYRRPRFQEICDGVIDSHIHHGYGAVSVHEQIG